MARGESLFSDSEKRSGSEYKAQDEGRTTPSGNGSATTHQESDFYVRAPSVSLPKGGGAIRGIGEKFTPNPFTGTASFSVPVYVSPGRSGFQPELSLSYSSGSGNSPFGLGWNLTIPNITRKTEKGLPQYLDDEESDVFILTGAEDLVPALEYDEASGQWNEEILTNLDPDYIVKRYRPRIEGLFARIELWSHKTDQSNSYWRSITKDNIISVYGKSETAKITDPQNKQHIFSWLLEETFDSKGNIIVYEYQADDVYTNEQYNERGVPVYERHRVDGTAHATNTYIKRIKYGNHTPFQKDAWYFQVVFDYGEHDAANPTPEDDQQQTWNLRPDPFSRYRAGFEIRTRRRCERILMFHHFPNELGQDAYLVRSTDITYINRSLASFVAGITQTGYIKEGAGYQSKSFPPVEFTYSQADLHNRVEAIDKDSLENLPQGVDGSHYRFVDLDAEGISGILTEQAGEYYYKRANGPASYDPIKVELTRPNMRGLQSGTQRLMDLDGDGLLSLVQLQDPTPGFFERTDDQTWEAFDHFDNVPNIDWQNPNLQFIDLNGDGFADVLYVENNHFVWFPSKAKKGFGEPRYLRKPHDEEKGPALVFADGTQSIYTAEMCADGLQDIVRIRNGEVCYWPNLGYGRFGAKVTMANAPRFTSQDQFRQDRIRLADIDGTGTTDILYLDNDSIRI